MDNIRKNLSRSVLSAVVIGAFGFSVGVSAGEIGDAYAADQTLTAEMMDNIKSAVNDNNTRVGTLEVEVAAQKTSIEALENPTGTSCSGNNANDMMVTVGSLCVDKYEASLWADTTAEAPNANATDCAADGGNCAYVAQSRGQVLPVSGVTFLQAIAACANAGKRLLTPGEFQMAALGTPPGSCNVNTAAPADTGANAGCVSRDHGDGQQTNDMVGNLYEFVDTFVSANGGVAHAGFMGSAYDTASGSQEANAQRFFTNAVTTNTYKFIGFRCAR